jgi:uncharacterized membrane-anchored protein YitT (DUF2179 family)
MIFKFQRSIFILIGLFLTAFGTKLLTLHSLTFGGTAGIATLGTFLGSWSWGFLFLLVNMPFFILSVKKMGWPFSFLTFLCILLISAVADLMDNLSIPMLPPVLAAILAGIFIGIGVSFVLNSGASLGGIHILALYLEHTAKINRGLTLFVTDFIIVSSAAVIVGIKNALISIISIMIASYLAGRIKFAPQSFSSEDVNESPETIRNS